jgi:glycosyltransferase involved in cell wall biosynthesis
MDGRGAVAVAEPAPTTATGPGSSDPPVVFTIVSANYLAFARGLMQSVRSNHPDAERYVFLADEPGEIEPRDAELFSLVPARDLEIPHYDHMAFRYSILEFNTALKPFAFRWLANRRPGSTITYLDPDIVVLSPLVAVQAATATGALAVLTPHIDGPVNDGKRPDEFTFLRVGAYNLGFISTGVHPRRQALIDWWADRLEFGAFIDPEFGTFTDQKWMDLVPGLFPDVTILRSPAYNLAYWNLPVRAVTTSPTGELLANGERVVFVHFSGANPRHPEEFSKHQNRYDAASIGALGPTYQRYLATLADNDHERLGKSRYAYERLRDGSLITAEMRALFRHRFDIARPQESHDPFGLTKQDFADAITTRVRLTRHALEAYRLVRRRPYVRAVIDRLSSRAVWTLRGRVLRAAMPPSIRVARDEARRADLGYPMSRPSGSEDQPRANLIGYFEGEFGVAEAGRQLARAAKAGGVELSLVSVDAGRSSRQRDRTLAAEVTGEARHSINILCVNADQTEIVAASLGSQVMAGRYNVGFWFWELARFPEAWRGAIDLLDEIWVPTDFVRDAVAAVTHKPVRTIGVAVDATPSRPYSRAEFGIPNDSFTFLFSFDFASYVARKNPSGVVASFRQAFPEGGEPVSLVLKTINGHRNPDGLAALQALAAGDERVRVMDGHLTRDEVFGLESVADCFVSLHRSEGFGLGLAESMSLGKPVIGTAYSGNMDFMDASNSCPLSYQLIDVRPGEYPHPEGQVWADPDIDQAAYFMRRLVNDTAFASGLGNRARDRIAQACGADAVGQRVARELTRILDSRPA